MKQAVSVSLGSSDRDKEVVVELKGQRIRLQRIGTDGDVEKARSLFRELDGRVDALSMGGADMYIRLKGREYPLYAALDLVREVMHTPVVDGRGLKHTLERRVFELAGPELGPLPRFRCALVPLALDRVGLVEAVIEVSERVVCGDLMFALGIPIPLVGLRRYLTVARLLMPLVSRFPMSMIFYGSDRIDLNPKFPKYWKAADLIAGDMMFIRKYSIEDLEGKTVITNTTTPDNIELLRRRGVRLVLTTTPRYEGRSFGTNLMEAALTAYAGKGRRLTDEELNALIDELKLRPTVLSLR
jgi:hypothetical protein